MPTYQYFCETCHHQAEIFQKITEDAISLCPQCGNNSLKRGPGGGAGLIFKGSGFYVNDYSPKTTEPTASSGEKNNSTGGCCPCGKNKGSCSDS